MGTIKIFLTKKEVEQAEEYCLDKIESDGQILFESAVAQHIVVGGDGQYDFEMHVFTEEPEGAPVQKHTIIVSQDESDETIKPGELPGGREVSLPSSHQGKSYLNGTSQDESDETIKPGGLPGNPNSLF